MVTFHGHGECLIFGFFRKNACRMKEIWKSEWPLACAHKLKGPVTWMKSLLKFKKKAKENPSPKKGKDEKEKEEKKKKKGERV